MTRNLLYATIGAFAVLSVVIGYHFYLERQESTGFQITVGDGGVSIEKK